MFSLVLLGVKFLPLRKCITKYIIKANKYAPLIAIKIIRLSLFIKRKKDKCAFYAFQNSKLNLSGSTKFLCLFLSPNNFHTSLSFCLKNNAIMNIKNFPILSLVIVICLFAFKASGQEINCQVQVSARQVEGTDRSVFENLQKALYEFVNARKWTPYTYKLEERIEASILLTINEQISTEKFSGQLNLVLKRPVYKSNFNTTLLNYIDKDVVFTYVENEPLEFSDNSVDNNLTAIIAFYINIFLGLDGDSFSPLGGTPYFERAQAIVQSAQSTGEIGWRSYESQKNRYWLSENLSNPIYRKVRESIYQYHLQGLDNMYDNADIGRNAIAESVKLLSQANDEKPGSLLIQLILDAKRDELIQIFSEGAPNSRAEVANSLKEMDPANGSRYNQILSR